MKPILLLCGLLLTASAAPAQRLWTEADQRATVANLQRTRNELTRAVATLTDAQWNFREAPGRWTIAEVVEHLGTWEIAFAREIGEGIRNAPRPDLAAAQTAAAADPDTYYREFIMEDKPHVAPDFARPTGLLTGKNALTFFQLKRDLAIGFADTTRTDMRLYYERTGSRFPRNMQQVYIFQWGHVDRHLRQIQRIKQHPDYPKS
ncbi:DinB family protein [Fibrella arboris]|uniref:DinB family protein n=1 Tax=Fibrella arboris TaxID=3242486 RepID=UPI00351FB510